MKRLFPLLLLVTACDPGRMYMRQVDQMPPEKRPPEWDKTKRLMARQAPRAGTAAPDFTLATPDGKKQITRSKFHADRPLVLVFGSFT